MSRFLGKAINSVRKDSKKVFSSKNEIVGIKGQKYRKKRKGKRKRLNG